MNRGNTPKTSFQVSFPDPLALPSEVENKTHLFVYNKCETPGSLDKKWNGALKVSKVWLPKNFMEDTIPDSKSNPIDRAHFATFHAKMLSPSKGIWRGTLGKNYTCLSNYLVTSVQRHLQVGAAFPFTNRSTVGSRSTVVRSVTNHLFRIFISRLTPSFTPVRNRTSAQSATFHAVILPPLKGTSRSTLGRNRTTAINAAFHAANLLTSKGISRIGCFKKTLFSKK